MEVIPRSILLICLCATPVAFGQARSRTLPAGPEAAMPSAQDVQKASCVLQVQQDMNRGSGDIQALSAMLTSTALVDPAAKKALGLSPENWPKVAQVDVLNAGQTALKLTITVNRAAGASLPPNAAEAFLKELLQRAKSEFDKPSGQDVANAQRKERLEQDLAAARAKLEDAATALLKVRQEQGTDFGRSANSAANERVALESVLVGQRARLSVLETAAAEKKQPSAVEAASELVALREKAVDLLIAQRKEDKATDEQLLEAQLRLAEARLLLATIPSRAQMPSRADEIVGLKASIAENEARLAHAMERIKAAEQAPRVDVTSLTLDEQRARQAMSELQMQLDQLNRQTRASGGGSKLLVLDGGGLGLE